MIQTVQARPLGKTMTFAPWLGSAEPAQPTQRCTRNFGLEWIRTEHDPGLVGTGQGTTLEFSKVAAVTPRITDFEASPL